MFVMVGRLRAMKRKRSPWREAHRGDERDAAAAFFWGSGHA